MSVLNAYIGCLPPFTIQLKISTCKICIFLESKIVTNTKAYKPFTITVLFSSQDLNICYQFIGYLEGEDEDAMTPSHSLSY
jgi:hypothetical protein